MIRFTTQAPVFPGLRPQIPHQVGGWGITPLDGTQSTSFFSAFQRFLHWLSFPCSQIDITADFTLSNHPPLVAYLGLTVQACLVELGVVVVPALPVPLPQGPGVLLLRALPSCPSPIMHRSPLSLPSEGSLGSGWLHGSLTSMWWLWSLRPDLVEVVLALQCSGRLFRWSCQTIQSCPSWRHSCLLPRANSASAPWLSSGSSTLEPINTSPWRSLLPGLAVLWASPAQSPQS